MQTKLAQATAVATLLLNSASALTDHPDGLGGNAPCLEQFNIVSEGEAVGGDPHLTHGLIANDKSNVGVGSALRDLEPSGFGAQPYRGLIIRTNVPANNIPTTNDYLEGFRTLDGAGSTANNYMWATKLGSSTLNSRANWVAESVDSTGSFYIAVGVEQQSGNNLSQMVIWKVNAADGAVAWQMNYGTAGTVSGLESVAFLADGSVIIGGFTDGEGEMSEQYFKSGGQIGFGKPFIAKIAATAISGSTAPTSVDWSYSLDSDDYTGSTKALRISSAQDGTVEKIYAVVGQKSAAVKLNTDGTEVWKTGLIDSTVQSNDLEVVADGLVLAGLQYSKQTEDCWFEGCGVIKGHMTKLDTTGAVQWSKNHGNYPDGVNQFTDSGEGAWPLIYNECWGIAPTYDTSGPWLQDGYVLACGTGIEGCPLTWNYMPSLWLECKGDKRATWRSLTVATDLNGERVWSRMDSFQAGTGEAWSSASEYVLSDTDGKITFISDEAVGFGFGTISAPDGVKCADTVSAIKLKASALLAIGALYLSL